MTQNRFYWINCFLGTLFLFHLPFSLLAEDASLLTNNRIFVENEFQENNTTLPWFHEGSLLIANEEGQLTLQDARYPRSSTKKVLVERSWVIPAGKQSPLSLESWEFSDDMSKLLIFTNSERVWRTNTRGDYWLLDLATKKLTQLGGHAEPSTLMFAKLSPDGTSVAYVRENNIYVENLATQEIKPLTTNGGERFINGTFDWVYEEEFIITDGFRWSPDSRSIAFWELDTEGEPIFTMIDNTCEKYPITKQFKYPRAGETNAAARIGVVGVATGETIWMNLPGDPRDNYITMLEWSKTLMIQQFNRAQNQMTLFQADPDTGSVIPILTDRDDAWVDLRPIHFFDEDHQFLFESERNGFRQIFRKTIGDDAAPSPVTPPTVDVMDFVAFDSDATGIYFHASPENATQQYLFHVNLDGQNFRRITPPDQSGVHHYEISPDGTLATHRYSSLGVPTVCEVVELPSHKRLRTVRNNAELVRKLKKLSLGKAELLQVEIEPGIVLDGFCIYPPNFDPAKKYPLLVYVYGEPAGQTVHDSWGGSGYLWHQMFAQKGYVVMSFDNRGTPAPKGRDWRKSIYRKIGTLGPKDQMLAVKKILEKRPYLDPKRVGIWGWSGGGSMTLHAMLQYPDVYTMGIAIASVPDERNYDTIYQERYMGNPQEDAEDDYRKNSPVSYAKNLKGELLLIHGTGDDNCHYQTTELFIDELIRHNKPFTMMAYPSRSHGIFEGEGTTLHLRNLMTRFIDEKLPVHSK